MSGPGRSFSIPSWSRLSSNAEPIVLAPQFPPPLSLKELIAAVQQAVEENFPALPKSTRRILIIMEDASRPTKTSPVVSALLSALSRRVSPSTETRILIAGGAHLGLDNREKYPPDAAGRVKIHNPYDTVALANIKGCPLYIDPEVIWADFRIAIGTVNLHPKAGFSGGSKILLPGAAGLPTIRQFHHLADGSLAEMMTPLREMADQVLQRFPVPFSLQLLSNANGDIWGLTSGELRNAWKLAIPRLLPLVQQPLIRQQPLCLADAGPFDENLIGLFKSLKTLHTALTPDGVGVLLCKAPDGLGRHAWRLDPSVMLRERAAWATRLGQQKIWVVSSSTLSIKETQALFPSQVRLVTPGENSIPSLNSLPLILQSAPLIQCQLP